MWRWVVGMDQAGAVVEEGTSLVVEGSLLERVVDEGYVLTRSIVLGTLLGSRTHRIEMGRMGAVIVWDSLLGYTRLVVEDIPEEEDNGPVRMDLFSVAREDIVDNISHHNGHVGLLVFFDEGSLRRTPVFLHTEDQAELDTFHRIHKYSAAALDN